MSWTDERVDLLKKLWMEGLSASQIAAELGEGVTRNAVIGKVHRLKLSTRAKPTSSSARPRPAAGQRNARRPGMPSSSASAVAAVMKRRALQQNPVMGATALKSNEALAEELYVAPAMAAEMEMPEMQRISLLELTEQTCKWPIGDPLTENFFFCGQHSLETGPYCEFHARRAYHQVEKRRR